MSILFVLLIFLLIVTVTYFVRGRDEITAARPTIPETSPPEMEREYGFDVPKGYCFHPGHTWVLDEGRQNARVGMDSFATNLFGKIDRIEVVGQNRWVRQGQKIMTVTRDGLTVEMLSPIEGIVMSVNPHVLRNPNLVLQDPYKDGWICVVKSPDMTTNIRNLLQGSLVAPWMQNTLSRLSTMTSQLSAVVAQDGGLPITGLLGQVEPGLQRRLVREFFLT